VDAVYPCCANIVLGDSDGNMCRRSGRRCEIRMVACGGNWSRHEEVGSSRRGEGARVEIHASFIGRDRRGSTSCGACSTIDGVRSSGEP
jgi:hypothetical protein